MGQTAYFKATSSSSDVTISNTFLMNCTLIVGNTATDVLLGGNSTSEATAQSSAVHPVSNDLTKVSIDITDTYFNPSTDGSVSATLQCFIGVEYQDVSYSKRTFILLKRTSIPTSTGFGQASANFQISPEENNTNPDPTSISSGSERLVFSFGIYFVILLFCFFLL